MRMDITNSNPFKFTFNNDYKKERELGNSQRKPGWVDIIIILLDN